MIVVDASIVVKAFGNGQLRLKILSCEKQLNAPAQVFEREVMGLKKSIMQHESLSVKEFEKIWAGFKEKITLRELKVQEVLQTQELLKSLHLDKNDSAYIALCLRKAPSAFWTYDYPFVVGQSAS